MTETGMVDTSASQRLRRPAERWLGLRRRSTHHEHDQRRGVPQQMVAASESGEPGLGRWLSLAGVWVTGIGAVLVLFVLSQFVLTDLAHARDQRSLLKDLRASFASEEPPPAVPSTGQPVALLRIPRIGVNEVVVEGSRSPQLKKGPGHYRGTPLPGEAGNASIAGRRTTYGAPFGDIGKLRPGDEIEANTRRGRFAYRVSEVKRVRPGQTDVLTQSFDNRLTLTTSNPKFLASERLVVVARGDTQAPAPRLRPQPTLAVSELGLAGDGSAGLAALVSAQFLLLASVLTWRLYRRWSRFSTWLLTTPVLVALTLLLFESLDRFLPATL